MKKARRKKSKWRKGNEPYHGEGGLYYTRPWWFTDYSGKTIKKKKKK